MDITEFKALLSSIDTEQLKPIAESFHPLYPEVADYLKEILHNAAYNPVILSDKNELNRLQLSLLLLSCRRQRGLFSDLITLVRNPELNTYFAEDSWLMRELHRVIGSLCDAYDLPTIGDLVLDPKVVTLVREQALLSFHFLWLERLVKENDIVEEYRRLLDLGLAPDDDYKLWMALVINAAVIGGTKLKSQVISILDSGRLSNQTSFVRKVVNGLFGKANANFRHMLRREHKGFYINLPEEIEAYCKPPVEEDIDMPEKGKPMKREEAKIGRNDPCPCGSGKKYKKCCGKDK